MLWTVVSLLLVLAACAPRSSDPAFESTAVFESSTEACSQDLCVEVRAPVLGNQPGVGSCALYGPGDPDVLDPLAESGDLKMRPGTVTTWATGVSGAFNVGDLNPVCRPMAEG